MALDLTVKSTKAQHWRERETVTEVLALIPLPRAVNLLSLGAKDKNGFVRQAAVIALGRTKHPAAMKHLIPALSDEIPHVRAAACRALSQVSRERKAIIPLTRDPSSIVRKAAKESLGDHP